MLLAAFTSLLPIPTLAREPRTATLVTIWSPQAQFAGYYVALEKGMYARHGVDLTIIPGGPGLAPEAMLRDGKADFAVLWLSSALRQRDAGTPLVHLAQGIQRSSMMLIAKRSSGIRSIADMRGRKVGVWDGDLAIPPRALFTQARVSVREVPQSHTINLFLRGGIDVTSAMWYNEYHTILNAGIDPDELSVFFLADLGLRFPEDGLYALERTVGRDPALADAVVRASREGWDYAFAHPDETLDIVIRQMRAAHLPANRVHQRWMLARMRELSRPADGRPLLGRLSEQDYAAVAAALLRERVIQTIPPYRAFVRETDASR
ncbi:MAG: ABC transporter substrate-binding protein [Bacteroidota bacterium]